MIGAGVSGLTTAICLAESGCEVTVAAAQLPQHTTSAAAGAIWGPHLVGMDDRVAQWGSVTLARADPATGVRVAQGVAASRARRSVPFDWVEETAGARPCDPAELPAGYQEGWRLTVPIVSMSVYLEYLLARLNRAGGQIRRAEFGSLSEAAELTRAAVIVNCSGIGAGRLVPDSDLVPVRGQVVIVQNPGLDEFLCLGGTEDAGDWSREPDPATAARILRSCAAVEPRLSEPTIIAHRVGLRPLRPSVRLEAEKLDGRRLLHNYGHGGAGVTLSWGCALTVAAMVAD